MAYLSAKSSEGGSSMPTSSSAASSDEISKMAYTTACKLLKITPSQSILKHLSSSEMDLCHRNLGATNIKALAASLTRNTSVESLLLEENGLEGEGCIFLCDMLMQNKTIKNVNLARNRIGSVGALALADLLLNRHKIERLNLADNELRDYDAEVLAEAIERNESVVDLNLSHNSFSDSSIVFIQAFASNNSIEKLDLSWNQMQATHLFSCLKRNYCLSHLDISWNGISLAGSATLCELLRGNKYLRELNVAHNRINWEGALNVSKGLKENDTLEVLYIGGNPLTMTGVLDILDAVESPQSALTLLDFKGVTVNGKIVYVIESLQKNKTVVVRHGKISESNDIYGRRMVLRCDPLKLLVQFMADKAIKPYDLFKTHDPEKQYKVPREHFVRGLKKAKVPLDEYDFEKLLQRFDSSGKESKINYHRLIKGVKEQVKLNKVEEKQRLSGTSKPQQRKKVEIAESSDEDLLSPRSTPSPSREALASGSPEPEAFKAFMNASKHSNNSSERSSVSSEQ